MACVQSMQRDPVVRGGPTLKLLLPQAAQPWDGGGYRDDWLPATWVGASRVPIRRVVALPPGDAKQAAVNLIASVVGWVLGHILEIAAGVVLVLFVLIWGWIDWQLGRFQPTIDAERLILPAAIVDVAGLLAASIGAATAANLGFEMRRQTGTGIRERFKAAVLQSPLVGFGILAYIIVGTLSIGVWLANSEEAPDMVAAFALGVIGWLGGAFSVVFRPPQ